MLKKKNREKQKGQRAQCKTLTDVIIAVCAGLKVPCM